LLQKGVQRVVTAAALPSFLSDVSTKAYLLL